AKQLHGLESVCDNLHNEDINVEVVDAVMDEAARFATEVFSPLNRRGDLQPARVTDKGVQETEGFAEAYQQFVAGGWPAMPCSPEYGGMGMPELIAGLTGEMWTAANMSLSLCPLLTNGAIRAVETHASEELKQIYLAKMISGEWSGTMNLTEPQAGSDLAAVRTKAEPEGDHYRISGTKIFITWGDHQMTENVVHLVLARLPDAPKGVKGISLFIVPKFLVNADGSIGERNDAHCASVEHKMGIHGSPTCVMNFGENDGAIGYLVGEAHQGLMYMFVMMNAARIHVGISGVAMSDRSYQQALDYAKTRVQGAPLAGGDAVTIINHPDVRRMLLQMRALTEASRAITAAVSVEFDKEEAGDHQAQSRIEYLTPIAKGWSTEVAQEVTSLGVQIHGGMGFVEETGAAQYMRDARIITIYEGTTGIQAMDLTGRKLVRDAGKTLALLMTEMHDDMAAIADDGVIGEIKQTAVAGLQLLADAAQWIGEQVQQDINVIGSAAANFLMLNGTVIGGYYMAKSAAIASQKMADDEDFYTAKIATARFYAQQIMPRAQAYAEAMRSDVDTVMSLAESQF
ncbi:MAG: acyl-CoA dehydrogenase, partial [Pseudomonadales bacterium]|nr:acyl-CoA dehydrogenase [Pseudomonadales bacterium]